MKWKFLKYLWKNKTEIFDDLQQKFKEEEEFKNKIELTTKVLTEQVEVKKRRKKFSDSQLNDIKSKNAEGVNWMDKFYTKEEQEELKKDVNWSIAATKRQQDRDKQATLQAVSDGFDNGLFTGKAAIEEKLRAESLLQDKVAAEIAMKEGFETFVAGEVRVSVEEKNKSLVKGTKQNV